MNTNLAALALLVALFSAGTTGCIFGCEAAGSDDAPAIQLTPSSVQATRSPAICGVVDPAFTQGDTYSLVIVGETDVPAPYNTLTLQLPADMPLSQPFPLDVGASASDVQSASLTTPVVHFTLALGSTPSELDTTPLDAVIVTATAMPSADGEPLSATLQLYFHDGSELDQSFSAPVVSALTTCTTGPAMKRGAR